MQSGISGIRLNSYFDIKHVRERIRTGRASIIKPNAQQIGPSRSESQSHQRVTSFETRAILEMEECIESGVATIVEDIKEDSSVCV
jgi:hypothetical protein